MKVIKSILLGMSALSMCTCQTAAQDGPTVLSQPADAGRLQQYIVYRHFLNWVNQLDKAATASRSTDPYKFAEPFSRANLQPQYLDILRNAAHQLDADIQQQDAKARALIARYREAAKAAVAQGHSLPAAPLDVSHLNREHTALLIQHYSALRAALGPDASTRFDNYLNYEFAPHIKLRRMAVPATPAPH